MSGVPLLEIFVAAVSVSVLLTCVRLRHKRRLLQKLRPWWAVMALGLSSGCLAVVWILRFLDGFPAWPELRQLVNVLILGSLGPLAVMLLWGAWKRKRLGTNSP